MVGYAVTCTADTTTEVRSEPRGLMPLWAAIEAAPKPVVLVIKDIGPGAQPIGPHGRSHGDDRQGARCGRAAFPTADWRRRRSSGARRLPVLLPGFVVSHGNPFILDINVPVTVDGMAVTPGDLLHGDQNGLVVIPEAIADRVAEEAERVRVAEREVLDFVRAPGLTVEKLREFQKRFRH